MTRREKALHEAGHAVAYIVLGLPLEYASIRRGKTFGGVAVAGKMPIAVNEIRFGRVPQQTPNLRAQVERRIIAGLAGELAALYLAAAPAAARYIDDESEAIALEALEALGPRIAELVVEHEERAEPTDNDETKAWSLAAVFADGDATGPYLAWLRSEARILVTTYSAAILRVADALEKHAALTGEQIAAVVHNRSKE